MPLSETGVIPVAVGPNFLKDWLHPSIARGKLFCIGEVEEIEVLVDWNGRRLQLLIGSMALLDCNPLVYQICQFDDKLEVLSSYDHPPNHKDTVSNDIHQALLEYES